ncbi:MAG: hypothetical protein IKI18_06840 [Prevotella sp.]|nr:hypothetical protein [Prevotella sp.]MBR7086591.1 hypothetical protein [Prevotella sp.]
MKRFTMKYFKTIILSMVMSLVTSSCCKLPYFIPQEDICYVNTHNGDTLNYEFASFLPTNSLKKIRCDLFQAISTKSTTVLQKNDIVVLQNGKPIKFKLYQATPQRWQKIKDGVTLPPQNLIMLSTKAKTSYGDSITVVERNYPARGDSIVVNIKFVENNNAFGYAGIYRVESVVGKLLPKSRSLENEANRYMFDKKSSQKLDTK